MSKFEKLLQRLKSRPADFAWDELLSLLSKLGFKKLEGKGSRVKFYHHDLDCMIQLHKPHPQKVLKSYMLKEILEMLKRERLI